MMAAAGSLSQLPVQEDRGVCDGQYHACPGGAFAVRRVRIPQGLRVAVWDVSVATVACSRSRGRHVRNFLVPIPPSLEALLVQTFFLVFGASF